MSLEGSLETIALPDILALLSVTAKSGELRVESGGGVGSIWFDAGRICGFDVGSHSTPVDALFALLRLSEGDFSFQTGTEPFNPCSPEEVAPALEEAENRLVQWPAISAAVPSLYSELSLRPSVTGAVTLRPELWSLVARIGGGCRVGDAILSQGMGEYEGCKAIKELVDMQLVAVVGGAVPAEAGNGLRPGRAGRGTPDLSSEGESRGWDERAVADLSEVPGGTDGRSPEAPEEVAPSVADPVNRGLLLKFLGSARN